MVVGVFGLPRPGGQYGKSALYQVNPAWVWVGRRLVERGKAMLSWVEGGGWVGSQGGGLIVSDESGYRVRMDRWMELML